MRRAKLPVAGLLLMSMLGCDAAGRPGTTVAGTATPTATAGTSAARELPYRLYTHCGIDEAQVEGRWYEAVEPLSDGSGNPPKGWGNPHQDGTLRLTSPTEAEFRDSAGHVVRFRLRPGATGPKRICA